MRSPSAMAGQTCAEARRPSVWGCSHVAELTAKQLGCPGKRCSDGSLVDREDAERRFRSRTENALANSSLAALAGQISAAAVWFEIMPDGLLDDNCNLKFKVIGEIYVVNPFGGAGQCRECQRRKRERVTRG